MPALRAQTSFAIGLTGFNGDIVQAASEGEPGASVTVSGFHYYETGATSALGTLPQGLPNGSRIFTSAADANVQFQFAPYTGANVVTLAFGNSLTLNLASPGAYQAVHFLATVQNVSGAGFNVTLNFSDSSHTTTTNFTGINDWTALGGSIALADVGLVGSSIFGDSPTEHLYLRQFDYALLSGDQLKTLSSITVNYTVSNSGGDLMFFGASGITSPIPEPSTYTATVAGVALAFVVWGRRQRNRTARS